MANPIKSFVSAYRQKKSADKAIAAIKPVIAQRKTQVAKMQFERGIGKQPRTKGGADKMLSFFR